jgi:hypothetical protein
VEVAQPFFSHTSLLKFLSLGRQLSRLKLSCPGMDILVFYISFDLAVRHF